MHLYLLWCVYTLASFCLFIEHNTHTLALHRSLVCRFVCLLSTWNRFYWTSSSHRYKHFFGLVSSFRVVLNGGYMLVFNDKGAMHLRTYSIEKHTQSEYGANASETMRTEWDNEEKTNLNIFFFSPLSCILLLFVWWTHIKLIQWLFVHCMALACASFRCAQRNERKKRFRNTNNRTNQLWNKIKERKNQQQQQQHTESHLHTNSRRKKGIITVMRRSYIWCI